MKAILLVLLVLVTWTKSEEVNTTDVIDTELNLPATLQVSPGGSDFGYCVSSACSTLAYAVSLASPNCTINVAAGVYIIGSAIKILIPGVTISGEPGTDLIGHAGHTCFDFGAPSFTLRGLNITNFSTAVKASSHSATITNCTFANNANALSLHNGTYAIEGCTFLNNLGDHTISTERSNTNIRGSSFSRNEDRWGTLTAFGNENDVRVLGCRFEGNRGDAGAVYNTAGSLAVRDSIFLNNTATLSGGVLYGGMGSVITVSNTIIQHNEALNAGGGISCIGVITITDSLIWQNRAVNGGGIDISQASGTITNTSIQSNEAELSGGGILYGANGGLHVHNCIITGNVADGLPSGIEISHDSLSSLRMTNTTLSHSSTTAFCCHNASEGEWDSVREVEESICEYPSCNPARCNGNMQGCRCSPLLMNATFPPSHFCDCDRVLHGDTCSDFYECDGTSNCTENSTCLNYGGGFTCPCAFGYEGNGFIQCSDIDECLLGSPCDSNASCINLPGSHKCSCNLGFSGDGVSCSDVDECKVGKHRCSSNSQCINSAGSYNCVCNDGFIGDGFVCEVPRPCPGDPPCSGHGACVDSACACGLQWSGPLCSLERNQPIKVILNETAPELTVRSEDSVGDAQFVISVLRLVEMDISETEVQVYTMVHKNFTITQTNSSENVEWSYYVLADNGASLVVTIIQFEDPFTNYTFADTTTTVPKHTLKVNVKVRTWPFKGARNSLWVEFGARSGGGAGGGNQEHNTTTNFDQFGNVQWTTTRQGSVYLFTQFIKDAIVDGQVRKIRFTDMEGKVMAIIPYFRDSAEVDPKYSVLLGNGEEPSFDKKEEKGGGSFPLSTILYIVVPVAGGLVLVAVVGVLLAWGWPKLHSCWKVRESKEDFVNQIEIYH